MIPSHLIFGEPASWLFYLILLIFAGMIVWSGFLSIEAIWAIFGLRPLRKVAQKASIPTAAIGTVIWFKTCLRVTCFAAVIVGTWIAIDANFRSFLILDISQTSIHISYDWHVLDKDLSATTIRSIDLVPVPRRDNPYFRLQIATTDGRVFRSVMTRDKVVIGDCRHIVDGFHK